MISNASPARPARSSAVGAVSAHAAWSVAACLALGGHAAMAGVSLGHAGLLVAALAGPAVAMAFAGKLRQPRRRGVTLLVWAAAAASVIALGGVEFAAWALTPLAAALAIGPRQGLWEGAGLSAAALMTGVAAATLAEGGAAPSWAGVLTTIAVGVFFAFSAAAAARRAETAAHAATQAAARTAALLDASPLVFCRVGFDGTIQDAAGPARAVLSVAEHALAGRDVTVLADAAHRDVLARAVSRALRFGETTELAIAAAGRPVKVALTPNGAQGVILTAYHDADLERLAQAQVERDAALARMEARSRFFAGMSHELRTPLNAILGFSETIRGRMFGPISSRYGEYVDIIHESGTHLLDLINSILDLSKMDAGRYELQIEHVDAVDTAKAAIRLTQRLAEQKSIALSLESAAPYVAAEADAKALKQILLNLISNAVKFTPEQGRVSVRVGIGDSALILEVADTGCGMSPEEVAAIGRPYVQGEGGKQSAEGTGLGLAIVRGFAELHGGHVEVESALDAGTTMRVILPVLSETDIGEDDARARQRRLDDDVSGDGWSFANACGDA